MASPSIATDLYESAAERLKRFDVTFLLALLGLLAFGALAQYSAGGMDTLSDQLFKGVIGLVPFLVMLKTPVEVWRKIWPGLYVINVLLLVAVVVAGDQGGGAQRWLDLGPLRFQPSEVSKLLTVLTLGAFLFSREADVRDARTFVGSLLHILPILALLMLQPHLGGTLTVFVAWFVMCLVAGMRLRFLGGTVLVAVGLLAIGLLIPDSPILKDYMRERVVAMIDGDPSGNTYQPENAELAIGSGGTLGVGYLNGERKGWVPASETDFIFSVVAEEAGFVGCVILLGLFGLFFWRILVTANEANDLYGKLIGVGVFGILAFHTLVNLGMNVRLFPVVGLWLPFLSYGGTALWLCMACAGLLLHLRSRSGRSLFE